MAIRKIVEFFEFLDFVLVGRVPRRDFDTQKTEAFSAGPSGFPLRRFSIFPYKRKCTLQVFGPVQNVRENILFEVGFQEFGHHQRSENNQTGLYQRRIQRQTVERILQVTRWLR